MPVNLSLDFKDSSPSFAAQPPLLEKIVEQYKWLHSVQAALEVKLLVRGGCYFNSSVGEVALSKISNKCVVKTYHSGYQTDGFTYSETINLSELKPFVGKLDLYANHDSQRELVTLEGESTFFGNFDIYNNRYNQSFLSSKKLILRPLRSRDGLIYQFTDGDLKILPHYGKDGKIGRLSAPSIASPLDDKGNNVNQLLFKAAKIIYISTAEILSELVE